MPNRFNQLQQYGDYKPIGLNWPFEQLAYLGEKAKTDYEADVTDLQNVNAALGKIKYADWDAPYMKEFANEWTTRLGQVTDLIVNKDPQARNALLKMKADWSADQRIPIFEYNYAQDEKWRAKAAELDANQTYRPWNDEFMTTVQGRKGLSQVPFQGITGYTHPYEDMAKVMSSIKPSSIGKKGERYYFDSDGKLGGYPGKWVKYGTDNSWEYLSQSEINEIARAAAPIFLQHTKGGNSYQQEILHTEILPNMENPYGTPYVNMGGNAFDPETYLMERTISDLSTVGSKQAFMNEKIGYSVDIPDGLNKKDEPTESFAPGVLPASSFPDSNRKYDAGVGKKPYSANDFPAAAMGINPVISHVLSWVGNLFGGKPNPNKANMETWNKLGGVGEGFDDEIYGDMINNYYNAAFYQPVLQRQDTKQIEALNKYYFDATSGNAAQLESYILPNNKKVSGQEFMQEYAGYSKTVALQLGVDNPYGYAGANLVTVTDADGNISQVVQIPKNPNPLDQILANMYSAKYDAANGFTSKAKPITLEIDGKNTNVYVDYEPGYDKDTGYITNGFAKLVNAKTGKTILTAPDEAPDPIFWLFANIGLDE